MFEKILRHRASWLAAIFSLGLLAPAQAYAKDKEDDKEPAAVVERKSVEENDAAVLKIREAKFTKDGADTCVGCHDEQNEYPVFPLFKTKHAVKADPRSPFADKQCESCHGAGVLHTKAKKKDKRGGTIVNFGKNVWTPVKEQNEKCLACHQTHQRIGWKGSSHEFNAVSCASCHKVHVAKDPLLHRSSQASVCFGCHAKEQAKFQQASHHPVREGQMACTECHDVHGENGTGALDKATMREKCASCHAEKRGPFLWEHAPAAEDCMLCHTPHGSNQAALLKKRPPQLCQECHSSGSHPSGRFDGGKLAGSAFLGVKGCANCHSQVHGSNHPSGVTQLR